MSFTIICNSEALWSAKAVRAVVQQEYQCRKGTVRIFFRYSRNETAECYHGSGQRLNQKLEQSICVWLGTSELQNIGILRLGYFNDPGLNNASRLIQANKGDSYGMQVGIG